MTGFHSTISINPCLGVQVGNMGRPEPRLRGLLPLANVRTYLLEIRQACTGSGTGDR